MKVSAWAIALRGLWLLGVAFALDGYKRRLKLAERQAIEGE